MSEETINRIVAIQEMVQNPGKVLYSAEYTMLFCRRVPVRFSAEGMFEYEYYGDWVRMAGSNYLSEFQRVPQRDTNFGRSLQVQDRSDSYARRSD